MQQREAVEGATRIQRIRPEKERGKIITTAKVGSNADLFPSILAIYAKDGDRILDATYGKGVFWKNVERNRYRVETNDLVTDAATHYDFRAMPEFMNQSFDMVVLDPPYAYSPKNTMKSSIADCYRLNDSVDISTMQKVKELYQAGMDEAYRILNPGGYVVVKTQDIIQAGKQWWMHTWVMENPRFICEDLFVLVQDHAPTFDPKWKRQLHARKNHSFFVVLRKPVKQIHDILYLGPALPHTINFGAW